MSRIGLCSLPMLVAVVACRPAAPVPDPAIITEQYGTSSAQSSPVREVEVIHTGCMGWCPRYRVKLADDGSWEWDGTASIAPLGRLTGKTSASRFLPLFDWLKDHPALYAASGDQIRCDDCGEIEFRFGLRSGKEIVIKYGLPSYGDEWWALSQLVEAEVTRQVTRATANSKAT